MTSSDGNNSLEIARWQRIAGIVAVVAIIVGVAGAFVDPTSFFRSYLFSYLYWYMLAMGCLGLALLHQMTGGRWGYAARPFYSAGARTLPLLALGFIPLAFGLVYIYPWAQPDHFEHQHHADNREIYLSKPFFFGRAIAYFAISVALTLFFTRHVADGTGRPTMRKAPKLAGLGACLIVTVVTLAVTDWGMTLDPDWYSTIYGGIYIAGGLMTATGLAAAGVSLACLRLSREDEVSKIVLHDLGKLLFAFLMVWAYFAFSQFLIIYSGNLPIETVWYHRRLNGGWEWVSAALLVLHFVAPFLFLLSREAKQDPKRLAKVALFLVLVHWIDLYWNITPSYTDHGVLPHWLDLVMPVAIGGVVMFEFFRQLRRYLEPIVSHWPHADVDAVEASSS